MMPRTHAHTCNVRVCTHAHKRTRVRRAHTHTHMHVHANAHTHAGTHAQPDLVWSNTLGGRRLKESIGR